MEQANSEPVVIICGWCPGSREKTLELVKKGKIVSHGICPTCQDKMEDQAKQECLTVVKS